MRRMRDRQSDLPASSSITLSSIRDLQSCTRYYLLQSSTSAAPAKPSINPPGGNWVTAEPGYTTGSTNSLYFCDLNIFSDGTFAYSDVSLSSSYEAAKAAYNKAQTAQDTADSAQEDIDNLLRLGSNTEDARIKIALEFMKQKPMAELTDFVKETFHDGYGLKTESGNLSSWAAEDGLPSGEAGTTAGAEPAPDPSGALDAALAADPAEGSAHQ